MFGLSPMHLLVIMVVLLLLFGSRLPEVARSIGRSVNEFKRGLKDVNDDVDDAMSRDDARRPELKAPAGRTATSGDASESAEANKSKENVQA